MAVIAISWVALSGKFILSLARLFSAHVMKIFHLFTARKERDHCLSYFVEITSALVAEEMLIFSLRTCSTCDDYPIHIANDGVSVHFNSDFTGNLSVKG